jgi:hypothetical protein
MLAHQQHICDAPCGFTTRGGGAVKASSIGAGCGVAKLDSSPDFCKNFYRACEIVKIVSAAAQLGQFARSRAGVRIPGASGGMLMQSTIADLINLHGDALTRAERQLAAVPCSTTTRFPASARLPTWPPKAGVSAPTVVRLVSKIGFKGFAEFQAALASRGRSAHFQPDRKARQLGRSGAPGAHPEPVHRCRHRQHPAIAGAHRPHLVRRCLPHDVRPSTPTCSSPAGAFPGGLRITCFCTCR